MSFVYLTILERNFVKKYVVFTTIDKACTYLEKQFGKYISSCKDESLCSSEFSSNFQPINVIKLFSNNAYWTLSEIVNIRDGEFACYMQRLHMDSID